MDPRRRCRVEDHRFFRRSLFQRNSSLDCRPRKDSQTIVAPLVEPKGVLAVQIPSTYDSPFHRALLEVSALPEWAGKVEGSRYRITYHDETFYYNLLSFLTNRMDLWTTTYFHILENHQNIVEWYSSTSLKPYLREIWRLGGKKEDFCRQILERCKAQYPIQQDGKIAFPFKRLFFIAWKV